MKPTCSFKPGFGGELGWTPGNVIFHRWGCGTNCHEFRVYDVLGQTIASGDASGIETSPGLAFVATFPTLRADTDPVVIRDLRTLAIVYTSDAGADVHVVNDIDWGGNRVATVRYVDSHDQECTLQVALR